MNNKIYKPNLTGNKIFVNDKSVGGALNWKKIYIHLFFSKLQWKLELLLNQTSTCNSESFARFVLSDFLIFLIELYSH